MDFSENITLQAQDEIESAHWTQKQVTLHTIFIIRHDQDRTEDEPKLVKESLVIISDCLNHDASTVYVFTEQLIKHLLDHPGPCPIKVIHRFTDNCASQYKCKDAFEHLCKIEEMYNITLIISLYGKWAWERTE